MLMTFTTESARIRPGVDVTLLPQRNYDTNIGQFTSLDTFDGNIDDPITLNHYLYAGADPVDNIDPSGHDFLGGLAVSIGIGTTLGAIGGGIAAGLNGSDILSGAVRGAALGAAGGALGFLSFTAFSAVAGSFLNTYATYWAATFLSGATTGSVLSAGETLYDTGDAEQALRQGLVGGIGGAIFAGIGGIVFRAAAPIWLRYIGRPQGLNSQQFSEFSQAIREGAGQYSDDIVVTGSRAAGIARSGKDIDVNVLVDSSEFDALIRQRFGSPNPGSAKESTMLNAIQTGKIQSGEAGLRSLRKLLENMLGIEVDISIILKGGPFDNYPRLPLS
jgi:RHS repeat-associated protein